MVPPQILRIKRKRAEEPVDSLFIETRLSDSKRRITQHDYVFRRLISNDAPPQVQLPRIIASQPGDERKYANGGLPEGYDPNSGPSQGLEQPSDHVVPRRFHLTHTAIDSDSSPAAIKERRKSVGSNHIAVFVEEVVAAAATGSDGSQSSRPTLGSGSTALNQPARKRPGASLRKVSGIPEDKQSSHSNDDALLHAAMESHARELDDAEASPARKNAFTHTPHPDDAMDTSDDYVYDTYERHQNIHNFEGAAGKQPSEMLTAFPASNGPIGYLVITEEDQPIWETYYDSDAHSSDERDWDSEQDDENAENYYGADYPEDEVDSADEFGHDPYRFRKGSDDEEFGSDDDGDYNNDDEADESSDDGVGVKPWKKTFKVDRWGAAARATDADDEDSQGE